MRQKRLILTFLIETISLCLFASILTFFNDDPYEFERIFLDFIGSARNSIKIVTFNLDYTKVEKILKERSKELDVFIVVDDKNEMKIKYLENFNIHVLSDKDSRERKALVHSKFVIVDDSKVWFGSANLTESSFFRDHNFAFITDEKDIVDAFEKEFENFLNDRFHNEKVGVFKITKHGYIIFSPKVNGIYFIMDEISKAKRKVYISMYAFTNRLVMDQLKVLSANGIEVIVLFDKSWNTNSSYSVVSNGRGYIYIQPDPLSGLLHDKSVLIDPGKRCKLICGSYNLTLSANSKNDEFIFITNDKKLCKIFENEFNNILKLEY